jgi:hypothetical protein
MREGTLVRTQRNDLYSSSPNLFAVLTQIKCPNRSNCTWPTCGAPKKGRRLYASASTSFFLRVASHARAHGDLRNAILTASAAFACRSSGGSARPVGGTHGLWTRAKTPPPPPPSRVHQLSLVQPPPLQQTQRAQQQLKAFLSGARNAAGEAWLHQRPTPLVAQRLKNRVAKPSDWLA